MTPEEIKAALSDEDMDEGYLKAGFLGFPKSGKTYTAALLAVAVKRHFKLKGPISMFDTEKGSVYTNRHILELTGEKLLARRARQFDAMMKWAHACVAGGVSVGIVDSITHPWRELCDSYLEQKNEQGRQRWGQRFRPQSRLQFQDWNVIKPRWAKWTDFYLNSPLHLIICGRAGYEYDWESNEKGEKELVKTGVKIKTESEFGFEPSLLIEMVRGQDINSHKLIRKATVLGDRFDIMDGAEIEFLSTGDLESSLSVVYNFFKPHIAALTPGKHAQVNTEGQSQFDMSQEGEDPYAREKRQRTIYCEEIQAELLKHFPTRTAKDNQAKSDLIGHAFGTRSWTAVENMRSNDLEEGLREVREILAKYVEEREAEEMSEFLEKYYNRGE